jgi:putative transposase
VARGPRAKHLEYLVSQYLPHFHAERPHQGLENQVILQTNPPPTDDVPELKQIVCHERLGGLLKHFARRAA